ncbi:hypothetical protein EIN_251060 [Entamoeba invadens IP1]|uniref:Rho-GAP domain-containing protein n=1 Tax=Entamoeba invadens IP1 TaxID=370355 RepID=A0A0A1UHA1_ENTIV|nr:hypothetical protein EIN_251060 [Entamoeba invadens IP1]ELP94962.1 hypothetical protein EIN_251060 [Entamoeba invadens IP1]|eukprot:XP_004261733.1 hypothetical protein EIN_251060 [Entamoeba invadens IP1]
MKRQCMIGVNLKSVPTINGIPYPIYDMLDVLSHDWSFILREGIFRVPGNYAVIKQVTDFYERGETVDLSQLNVDVVASLLKNYLKLIPNKLISDDERDMFDATIQIDKSYNDIILMNMINAVSFLKLTNYLTLKHVIFHLRLVSQYSRQNLMDVSNLATVFAPAMFSLSLQELMNKDNYAVKTIVFFIENYDKIFISNVHKTVSAYMEPTEYQLPRTKNPQTPRPKETPHVTV